jgi:hypothetical protein
MPLQLTDGPSVAKLLREESSGAEPRAVLDGRRGITHERCAGSGDADAPVPVLTGCGSEPLVEGNLEQETAPAAEVVRAQKPQSRFRRSGQRFARAQPHAGVGRYPDTACDDQTRLARDDFGELGCPAGRRDAVVVHEQDDVSRRSPRARVPCRRRTMSAESNQHGAHG